MSTFLLAGCGGTGVGLDLVSDQQVEQMGAETWQRIRSETPASNNRRYQQTVDEIVRNLAEAAGEDPGTWEAVVFQGNEANAFALPGRRIGVYEGMFQVAENEAQLAAVIGHEIAHVEEEHSQERVSSQVATQGAVQLVSAALQVGNVGYANAIAGALGAGAQYGVLLPYGRNQELEADQMGLRLMARAGYDPREAVGLWRRMQEQGGAAPPEFLSTHPAPGNRIEQLQAQMDEALEIYQGG
ncbi:MAG: M48 family metallopeptidase [Geminicoccaceae bacterium]|nr:M48 family metallopeptidase [Geminicoccaceae bacterium]